MNFKIPLVVCVFLLFLSAANVLYAQFVNTGNGSYTTVFPGADVAGRNKFPSGTPLLSGVAATKPVPTNDWWSSKVKNNHVDNLFSYPYALKTVNSGFVISYIPWGVIDDILPVTVGVTNLNAAKATVADFSDWTVTMNWNDGVRDFNATAGIGMPFIYFTKGSADVAAVKVTSGTVAVHNEMLVISNARNGADFAVYAPVGSTWVNNAGTYTSTLNGQNYWSMAFIPLTATDVTAVANEYKKYAYVFPVSTSVSWAFNETTSVVRTEFMVSTEVKEGSGTKTLMGLLPHQWANLAPNSPSPDKYSYATIRGELKTLEGNSFSVENTFHGILPTLPYLSNYSEGFSPAALNEKIRLIENDGLATWTDSYNEGQVMNRLIQTARIADMTGNTQTRNKIVATIKERLEDWLKAEAGEVAFLFYYNSAWSALIGYPAGHMQDENLNDHHFHWGYFIHAAAFLEQFDPGWAANWGPMIDMLIRDAANPSRTDNMFPFLRNFSPFAGHCWANGFASFPQGNDQESTSESMQFNSSLIHWGLITGNDQIRDLGIYLYTTEQTAIEEYWFDMYQRNFKAGQQYGLVSRVWGNSYDNGTFWTSDIAASYGIEMYPIHGGSLYLGHNKAYVSRLWNEIKANTGIMGNQANPNLWHDVMWEYCAFIDPQTAIQLYNSYPDRGLKFGVSDAQTYYWLHSMNALGSVEANITADYPLAAVFNKNGELTYVAHNYSNSEITVTFSDNHTLKVPANSMATNKDVGVGGTLSSSFDRAFTNGSVGLHVAVSGGNATKVEFFDGNNFIGEDLAEPFLFTADNLTAGKHSFYAKIYDDEKFSISNIVPVVVGSQLPYSDAPVNIPGVIEAGKYDRFEGGNGQGMAYFDISVVNEGDFRKDEYVDGSYLSTEGAVVGWISGGEWMEYSVDVQQAGYYSLSFRYACGNNSGGGPFAIYLDNNLVKNNVVVAYTGGWDKWVSKTVNGIPLASGKHILKLAFDHGEVNLGRFNFEYSLPLDYDQPVANAGGNRVVVLPETSINLDGSASTDPLSAPLTYLWTQVYGPSVIEFSDRETVNPQISLLTEGVYLIKLTVSNGSYADDDEIYVIVSPESNIAPVVSITAPVNNYATSEGKTITISANATDLDGAISEVAFFQNNRLIGTDYAAPYSIDWAPAAGDYEVYAVATDNNHGVGMSQTIKVSVAPVLKCSETSNVASQGAFTSGYGVSFETIGNDVEVTFELFDDKTGVVAYLWKQTPFTETAMTHIGGKKFSARVSGLAKGSIITYACKFAYSGGMSVTKYFSYTVGDGCLQTWVPDVNQSGPVAFYDSQSGCLRVVNADADTFVSISDLRGCIVYSRKAGAQQIEIDMAAFKQSVYLVKLQSPKGVDVVKILLNQALDG